MCAGGLQMLPQCVSQCRPAIIFGWSGVVRFWDVARDNRARLWSFFPPFIKPCLPSKGPPSGSLWVHEIKHDGYRLMCAGTARGFAASPATAMTGPTTSLLSFMAAS